MTTVFGDRADFAIEAGVEPHLRPPSAVWGHMCAWCRGVALGDLTDRHNALYPGYQTFPRLPDRLDELWANEFVGLDDVGTWNFLDALLYGYHGDVEVFDERTAEDCGADWERWARHNFLTNWGVSFDSVKAFILCPPGDAIRILYRHRSDPVRRVEVSRAGLTAACAGFARWFEREERRLRGTDKPDHNKDRG